ncbi:LysR family transcriptional regulator [Klebsiella sp. I138]|uniref:LysR family transcriptional regulator n=1 Tax=Klebsiella sp. I138 TaxID=2755385 RepID=UPI003DA965C7
MTTLHYSFAQIEAFATIAETGSLSRAAIRLGKDRTTLRDLLDYLEDALGYALFLREGRSLALTPEGEQLFRQAHLLLRQAQAFESFAQTLPHTAGQALRVVYDPFVPRQFLCALTDHLARYSLRISCWSASRREAEQALADGQADLAICQANNRTLGSEMEWRALGTVDLRFYAAEHLFADSEAPLTLLNLSLVPQLVMHRRADEQIARRVQISGHTLYMNEKALLRHALQQGQGWGFLPDHFQAAGWEGVKEIETEVGNQGLNVTMVMLWLPGMNKHPTLGGVVDFAPQLWGDSA